MQLRFTRRSALLATPALALGLAACGGSDQAADGKATVRVGTWDGGEGLKSAQALADQYMKAHPDVTVKIESTPTDYGTKLLTQLASGTAPDIMQLGDGDISAYQAKGVLTDLTPYIEKDGTGLTMSDYVPEVMDIGKIGGKYFTIGGGTSLSVYVNKAAFEAAGLPMPTADWTWDQMQELARKLTIRDGNGNVTQYGVRFNGDDLRTYLPFLYCYGGDVISQDGTKIVGVADSSESVAGWSKYNELMNVDKVTPGTKAVGANAGADFFLAPEGKKVGHAAMLFSGDWGGRSYVAAGMDFAVLPVPVGPAGQFTTMYYSGLGINAKSKNTQAAWDYLKFWATEGQMSMAESGSLVPYKPALTKFKLDTNPASAEFVKSFGLVKPFPELLSPKFSSSGAAPQLVKVLTEIQSTNGSVDVAAALKKAAGLAQADLDSGS